MQTGNSASLGNKKSGFSTQPGARESLKVRRSQARGAESAPRRIVCLESWDLSPWIFISGTGYGNIVTDESLTPVVLPQNYRHLLTAASPSVHINASIYLLAYFTRECVCACACVCVCARARACVSHVREPEGDRGRVRSYSGADHLGREGCDFTAFVPHSLTALGG